MKRLMNASNFTQQTNALDVDKHMCVSALQTRLEPIQLTPAIILLQDGLH